MNSLGHHIRLTSYGESHGEVIGAVLDGFPPLFAIDINYIQKQLNRRKPGQSAITTTRKEDDEIIINSGLFKGKTTGAPIHFQIRNKDYKSDDYEHLKKLYRPSHADFSYESKYGIRDYRGGGRSSARITAAWVAAGALAQDYLQKEQGLDIQAYVKQIGKIKTPLNYEEMDLNLVDENMVRCPDPITAAKMIKAIEAVREEKDSLGGIIECIISGLPAGVGHPVFSKLQAQLGHAMLSINAVKAFELGGGFEMCSMKGSEVNDAFVKERESIRTLSNFSGGMQGGISNGSDIILRLGFKPVASIGKEQNTVNQQGEAVLLETKGRHDPCVVPRAIPIVESLAALVILDALQ